MIFRVMFTCGVHMWFTVYDVRMWFESTHDVHMWSPHVVYRVWCSHVIWVRVWCSHVESTCGLPHVMFACDFRTQHVIFRMWSPHVESTCGFLTRFFQFYLFNTWVHMWFPHVITCKLHMWSPCVMFHMWFECPHVESTCDFRMWSPHVDTPQLHIRFSLVMTSSSFNQH